MRNMGPELLKLGYIPKPDEEVWVAEWREKGGEPAAVYDHPKPARLTQELIDDFIQDRGSSASVFVMGDPVPADPIKRFRLFPSEPERDNFTADLRAQLELHDLLTKALRDGDQAALDRMEQMANGDAK